MRSFVRESGIPEPLYDSCIYILTTESMQHIHLLLLTTVHACPADLSTSQRARLAEQERVRVVSSQCCAALHESDGVGERADGVFKQKWPKIW